MTFALCPQSLDELDDDEPGERERREEEALVQANTHQNEAMSADGSPGHLLVRRLLLSACLQGGRRVGWGGGGGRVPAWVPLLKVTFQLDRLLRLSGPS